MGSISVRSECRRKESKRSPCHSKLSVCYRKIIRVYLMSWLDLKRVGQKMKINRIVFYLSKPPKSPTVYSILKNFIKQMFELTICHYSSLNWTKEKEKKLQHAKQEIKQLLLSKKRYGMMPGFKPVPVSDQFYIKSIFKTCLLILVISRKWNIPKGIWTFQFSGFGALLAWETLGQAFAAFWWVKWSWLKLRCLLHGNTANAKLSFW